MNKKLKFQSAWLQLAIFLCFTVAIFFIVLVVVTPIVARVFELTWKDLSPFDFSKPNTISALKVLQAVSSVSLFLIPSLLFAYLSDKRPLSYIGFKKPVPLVFFLIGIAVIISALPMVAWLGQINQHLRFPSSLKGMENWIRKAESENNTMLRHLLVMKSPKDLFVMVIILAVIPAIGEEFFFRGVVQRLFIQILKRPWSGIILTAIIFSAIHGQFLGFFPRAVLGVVLGALFWYSGSLWPGILAHFLYNALQIILVYYSPQFVEKNPDFAVSLVTVSILLVISLTWWMAKISETSFAEVYDTDDDFTIGSRDQYLR